VEELESKDTFSVVLSNGTRETGMIHRSPEANDTNEGFSVQSAGISTTARNYDVVVITPVQDTFLHQLTGSINYGFDFTGGSNSTQSTFSGNAMYRSERWAGKLEGSSVVQPPERGTKFGPQYRGRLLLQLSDRPLVYSGHGWLSDELAAGSFGKNDARRRRWNGCHSRVKRVTAIDRRRVVL
jgi:hypothetical protein